MSIGAMFPSHFENFVNNCYTSVISCPQDITSVCFKNNGLLVTLSVERSSEISENDFILPSWACEVLNIKRNQCVSYETVVVLQGSHSSQVNLIFKCYKNNWQWTEVIANDNYIQSPQAWNSNWPESINISVLGSMLPSILMGWIFTNNALIAVKVFDLLVLFQVQIEGIEGNLVSSIKANNTTQYNVCVIKDKVANESTVTHQIGQYVCYPSVMSRLTNTVDMLINSSSINNQRFIYKSFLLCGSEGVGKTHLLSQFTEKICQTYTAITSVKSTCHSISTTLTSTSIDQLNKLLSVIQKDSLADSSVRHLTIAAYMSITMDSLGVTDSIKQTVLQSWNNNDETKVSNCIVWIIDDLDQILKQYSTSLESASINDDTAFTMIQQGNEYQIVGYLLHKLLKLLSDYKSNSKLIMIGACRMDSRTIPRSFTGAPEFEKVISLPRINKEDRNAILNELLEQLIDSMNDDVSLGQLPISLSEENTTNESSVKTWSSRLSSVTAGYCPGDLIALIKHTTLLHRGKTSITSESNGHVLEWSTVMQAMLALPPKQLQSLGIESSTGNTNKQSQKLSWNDFGGYTNTINQLKRLLKPHKLQSNDASNQVNNSRLDGEYIIPGTNGADFINRIGSIPKGIVIYGPTGCGKSLLAKIIASEANMNFVSIRSTEILSQYFGQTESAIRSLFQRARSAAPCVLFFDEFDAIAYKRGADEEGGNGLHGRVLSTFLNELDGVTSQENGFENSVMVLAACSDVMTLDEALIRPGRLQYHILLDKPTCSDVQSIIECQLRTIPYDESTVNIQHIATLLMAMNPSCADAEALCQKALFNAIREEILSNNMNTNKKLQLSHFNTALSELTGISIEYYNNSKPRQSEFVWSGSVNFS